MTAKLMLSGMTMVTTLLVIWQVSQAGWIRPPAMPPEIRSATGGTGVATHRPESVIAEGRLVTYPGAEVVIATELAGMIVELPVRENLAVRKGDLIAELQSDELRALRDEAIARIEEAESEVRFFEREAERRRVLVARRAASDAELDTDQRGLGVSRARYRAAVAARRRYDVLIAKTRITSPIDGVVVARFAHPGETVDPTARLATVADLKRVRIEAEVDEVDIGGIALDGEAVITAEGFPGRTWRGRVEEIPSVVVGRHLRPEDTARPVDTRVLLVKIALLEPTPLKLGQRVELEILSGSH